MWGITPPTEKIPEALGLLIVAVIAAYLIIKMIIRYFEHHFNRQEK
jgi:hypothetical protein